MNQRFLLGLGGVLAAVLLVGTASASALGRGGDPPAPAQQSPTPTATATPTGGPGNRPATPPGQGRPDSAGTAGARGGQGLDRQPPQLPANASPRAVAAVAAAAQLHSRLSDRLQALRALPPGAGRNDAVKLVMADFGDLFHLVSDAVHSVEQAQPDAKPSGTPTGTASGTPTSTPTT